MTTGSDPVVTVTGTVSNVGDRPVRDVVARLEHAPGGHLVGGTAHRPRRRHLPVRAGRRLHHRRPANCSAGRAPASPSLIRCDRRPSRRWASTNPASTRCWSTSTAPPTTANRPDSTTRASCCRCSGCPATATPAGRRRTARRRRRSGHHQAGADHHALAAGRPSRGWRPGVPGGTTPVRLMDDELATSLAAGGRLDTLLARRRVRHQPGRRPRRRGDAARCVWPSTRTCWSPSTR